MGKIKEKFDNAILNSKYKQLSEYNGVYKKVKIRCKNNHIYEVIPKNFANGSRCPICSNRSKLHSEEKFLKVISENNYIPDSEYISTNDKIRLICPEGHIWETIPKKFKNGQRCPKCQNICSDQAREKFIEIIVNEGYILLSEYKSNKRKVKVMCNNGHEHEVLPNNFTHHNSRCPHCKGSTGQRKLQTLLEENIEHKMIYNDRTILNGLELDIYFPELNIAIEYQGDYWHSLENVKERDERKRNLCKEKGIHLIEVLDSEFIKDSNEIFEYIFNMLNNKR